MDNRSLTLYIRCYALNVVSRSRNNGERSKQFVGDIGEYHSHLQTVLGAQTFTVPENGEANAHDEECYIYKVSPP